VELRLATISADDVFDDLFDSGADAGHDGISRL
jgi:hypothetical protein